jgi:hypothetical protein
MVLRYMCLHDLRAPDIRKITNFVNSDASGKNSLDRLEPVFVDLQGFNLGIECGGRNAKFGSSA